MEEGKAMHFTKRDGEGWQCDRCHNVFPEPVVHFCNAAKGQAEDRVNHPKHYNAHPSGIECIQVVEHMNFNIGNAVKYLWRSDHKGAQVEDLKKAAWYINREIERLGKQG